MTTDRFWKFALHLLKTFPTLGIEGESADDVKTALLLVGSRLTAFRRAWVAHDQFEHWQTLPQLSHLPFDDPTWAEVVMVYRHAPGVDGATESYVVCSTHDLNLAYAWATKTRIGDFAGIRPITERFYANPERITLQSNTHDGRAKGYHCRDELKKYLPGKLRKWVNKERRAKRFPKYAYLGEALACNGFKPAIRSSTYGAMKDAMRALPELPEWYRERSKGDLWVEMFRVKEPVVAAQIDYWIPLGDFYKAVTGQMNPNDVRGCFRRIPRKAEQQDFQLEMF